MKNSFNKELIRKSSFGKPSNAILMRIKFSKSTAPGPCSQNGIGT